MTDFAITHQRLMRQLHRLSTKYQRLVKVETSMFTF